MAAEDLRRPDEGAAGDFYPGRTKGLECSENTIFHLYSSKEMQILNQNRLRITKIAFSCTEFD